MNEICKNCGKLRREHGESVGSDGETYIVCPDIDDTFHSSGLVAVPQEFVEAVKELVDYMGKRIGGTPMNKEMMNRAAIVRSMLSSIEKGATDE